MQTEKTKPLGRCPLCKCKLSGEKSVGLSLYKCSKCSFVGFENTSAYHASRVYSALHFPSPNREPLRETTENEIWQLTNEMEKEMNTVQLHLEDNFISQSYQLFCKILKEI